MRKSLLFIAIFIFSIKCDARTRYRSNYDFNSELKRAYNFLEEIKSEYAGSVSSLNEDALAKINRKITGYFRNASNIVSSRRKRQSTYKYSNEGIDVFDGFEDFSRFDHDGMRDMELFSLEDKIWFAAVLDDREVSVHRITINDGSLNGVASYPVMNGTRLIVNGCTCGALLIIEHRNGSVLVLSFTRILNDNYTLQANDQDLGLNSTVHLMIWNDMDMNQLYLGVATPDNVSIYTWFGRYFDLTQVIDRQADKLIPFRNKGSMHLALTAANSADTLIFRHFLESNEFRLVQRLPPSRDVSFFEFQFTHGRFADRFLCLSTGASSIVYKQIHDRFVPFQQIPLRAKFTVPTVSIPRKAILLFGIHEAAITAYQYDGWRFLQSNSPQLALAVDQFRPIFIHGNELLLIKSKDHGRWTLKRPVWVRKSTYVSLQDEAKRWIVEAKSRAQRTIEIVNSRLSIEIFKGRIDRLRVSNINGHDSRKLIKGKKEYEELISKLEQSSLDYSLKEKKTLTLDLVRAKRIQVKCKGNCTANRLYGENLRRIENIVKSKMMPRMSLSNYYRTLNVGEVKEWKCPFVSLPTEDVIVHELINGVPLNDFKDRAFKVTGNENVSGEHMFANLIITDLYAPLNIAANFTSQRLIMKNVVTKRLELTTAGILLPLNGSTSTITGSIVTDAVRVKHIRLKGRPTGDGTRRLRPVIFIDKPMYLNDNFTVENVKIENLEIARLINEKAGSVEAIFENAISLRSKHVPVSLTFSSKKTKLSDVVFVRGGPWVTQNSSRISGKKRFLQNTQITKSSRDRCHYPKIRVSLCGNHVIAPEIQTRVLAITNGTVKNVTSIRAFGRLGERHSSVSPFDPVFPNPERYLCNNVTATNLSAMRSNGVIEKMKRLENLWFDRDSLVVNAASFDAVELTGNSLLSPVRLDLPTSKTIRARKVISEKNSSIRVVNRVVLNDFFADAIKIDRMISLANVNFRDGFTVGCVNTFRQPPYVNSIFSDGGYRLGKKNISGHVEVNAINVPQRFFEIARNESSISAIVLGSARFSREPRVKVVNGVILNEWFKRIWLIMDDAVFRGVRLRFRDAITLANVTGTTASTMYPETWENISRRVFSKTKLQEISVDAFFENVQARTLAGSDESSVKCLLTDFGDTFENSLLKNENRKIRATWTFDKINVTEELHAGNTINGFDFRIDVARYDSKENVFSGKKTILSATAENFEEHNLQEWLANTLTTGTKPARMIQGRKIFKASVRFEAGVTVTASKSPMKGIVIIDDSLLSKSANQTIRGRREVHGFFDAPKLVVNGLVNDVNLTELTNSQLRKRIDGDENRLRRIKTSIEFRNSLNIDGCLVVNGSYANAEMSNLYANYLSQVSPIVHAIEKFSLTAEAIVASFADRAMYLNKLEIVRDAAFLNASELRIVERIRCDAAHFSPRCTGNPITDFSFWANTSDDFLLLRSVVIDEKELVVLVKHDSVSIFLLGETGSLNHSRVSILDLHISKIIDAFLEEARHSLWIVLRLNSHALVLRYRPCQKVLENYVLPGSDVFVTDRSPNGQLLLISSDGLWNLGGLATPRNIVRIPFEEKMEILASKFGYYLKSISPENRTTLMKARYVTMAD